MICDRQFNSGSDFAIVPGGCDVQAKWLVMMEVGDEDFVCHGMLLFLMGDQGPRADTSAVGAINRPLLFQDLYDYRQDRSLQALGYSGFSVLDIQVAVWMLLLYRCRLFGCKKQNKSFSPPPAARI